MFQWNARFAIGEELVDNEHAQLFTMLGRIAENTNFNASIYRPVVEALIHLWTDATDRIGELEKVLEEHDIKAH